MLLAVDVGGTFTDAVLVHEGGVTAAKAPTTPADESQGVLAAVSEALAGAGAEPAQVSSFAHGMTVGTNALLQASGARTALIATEGFTDLLDVGRQNRRSLYRLCEDWPPPLVAVADRIGVRERIGASGVVEPLSEGEIERVCDEVAQIAPQSVAICLLFSYADDSHERALADAIAERVPGVHVSASSSVLPLFREFERCSTTVVDAYLAPLLASYLGRLAAAAAERGLPEPLVMRSSGGLATLEEAGTGGVWSVLSGPAGGAVATEQAARRAGFADAIGLDMGGTSCDVCVVEAGAVRRTGSRELAGRPIQLPLVDIETVGAGGGSIGWADEGGALRAGPRSAGAVPGPACYGRGGAEPTVTDANLALGYLPAGGQLAGGVALDPGAATAALARLGDRLGIDALTCAEGIVRVANHEMLRALRVMTVERGIDPREFALVAFGGAGALHATALAEELEISTILCPPAAGVLSALGMTAAERRRETARTVQLSGPALTAEAIAATTSELIARLMDGFGPAGAEPATEVYYGLRYRGQSFELPVPGAADAAPGELAEAFATAHERRYGYRDPEGDVELVNVGVAVTLPGSERAPAPAGDEQPRRSRRRARFGGEWLETDVIEGDPAPATVVAGPAVIERPASTIVVAPGWSARTGADGAVVIGRDGR